MKKAMSKYWVFVIAICGTLAITNSISFFVSLARKPVGTTYLGTIHYWEDYFLYLNHFFQGAHGAWLTVNRYTSEVTSPSIIYSCNVLLGKIGSLFFLSPILSYNIGVLLLSFTALFLTFLFLRRIFASQPALAFWGFVTGSFATSLINRVHAQSGGMTWWPFQIWRTPHFVFDRLGGATHQQFQTIFAYLFFILLSVKPTTPRKEKIALWGPICVNILLTIVNPIQSVFYVGMLYGAYAVIFLIRRTKLNRFEWLRMILLGVTTGLSFLYISGVLNELPHVQSKLWEASQHSYTNIPFLLLSIGPIVPLAIVGLFKRWKNITLIEMFGLLTIASGYILFLSKIPQTVGFSNLRVLFPASYVFWGLYAAYGVQFLSEKIRPHVRFLSLISIQTLIVTFYMCLSLPTVWWEIQQKLTEPNPQDQTVYLKSSIMSAFDFLSKETPYDDVVLANPDTHMDTLVPAFSGHTVYSGHMLATVKNDQKQKTARDILTGMMKKEDARLFFSENRIRYILMTPSYGNLHALELKESYPFLTKLYENSDATVYETQ
jgi:hypothetical protein